jgi:hypothetical protein
MMRTLLVVAIVAAIAQTDVGEASTRTSANYSIPADSIDAGGIRVQSANYSVIGSGVGELGAGSITSSNYTDQGGFAGEVAGFVGLSITVPPSNNLNEGAGGQLVVRPLADDGTPLSMLDPSTVTWSIVAGPLNSISAGGLATADHVYQDTIAIVGGTAQGLSGQLNLTVVNTGNDDFGAYAGDQIDDSWQVQYFGQPPNSNAGPNADPDGDGQNNLFEFAAGLVPTDPNSRFALNIQPVSGQPGQKNIIFNPLVSGRTYTVQFRANLITGSWNPLAGTTQSDNGNQRTVTDPNATPAPKYYRVQISKP